MSSEDEDGGGRGGNVGCIGVMYSGERGAATAMSKVAALRKKRCREKVVGLIKALKNL